MATQLTIIPISGDAATESLGRILRLRRPTPREAFDNDLKQYQEQAKQALEIFISTHLNHPGTKTDILGSVVLAEQELRTSTGASRRLLIILSDFIQEDHELDFKKDNRLIAQARAKRFASLRRLLESSSPASFSYVIHLVQPGVRISGIKAGTSINTLLGNCYSWLFSSGSGVKLSLIAS